MSSSFDTTARRITRAAVAVSVAILVMGCGKKEAKETESSQSMPTEEPSVAAMPADVSGTYTAELPAGDTSGRKVSLTLNTDHTAMMSTDYMNDQPAVMQEGTWTEGESMIDVTFVGATGDTTALSFHVGGPELHLMNAAAAGFGTTGVTLMKEGGVMDSPEEHQD